MAGGAGTRLSSVVKNTPKIMAPVGDKPFLEILLTYYYRQGARNIILSLHYFSDQIITYLNNFSFPDDLQIQTVVEPEPLGTGGAVRYVMHKMDISGSAIICNGDTFLPNAWDALSNCPDKNLLGLIKVNDPSRYGTVQISKNGLINKFSEKDSFIKGPALINCGISHLLCEDVMKLPEKAFCSLENELYPMLVNENRIYGSVIDTDFIDIGIPEDYKLFCNKMI